MYRMLLINPGSTSTKIAVFEDENNVYEKTLRHTAEELAPFPTVASQKDFRKDVIIKFIAENNIDTKFDIIVGRGGMLKPIEAGAYEVNDEMIKDPTITKEVSSKVASTIPTTPPMIRTAAPDSPASAAWAPVPMRTTSI